ncbi:MAG: sulfotransferase family 2 domain-containing protein [Verrucomicrobia bacterium]|nr:sulfotransferase family 2 domain-containing protein [Verrucomicrobiota bacterium]MCH8527345.1 sulfotransferase family protein [Kiritimatiellia bacterium]
MKNIPYKFSNFRGKNPDLGSQRIQMNRTQIKAIYMHIHKCAGTSLIKNFETNPKIISCSARPGDYPNRTGRELIPDHLWDQSFKFTFVRNPYDRVLSAYLMFSHYKVFKPLFDSFLTFLRFLEWTHIDTHTVYYDSSEEIYDKKLENIIHHCSTYHNPKYHIDNMDFVGKVEEIDKGLKYIESITETTISKPPRLNQSKRNRDYKSYYNTDEKIIVTNLYQKDMERFKYIF